MQRAAEKGAKPELDSTPHYRSCLHPINPLFYVSTTGAPAHVPCVRNGMDAEIDSRIGQKLDSSIAFLTCEQGTFSHKKTQGSARPERNHIYDRRGSASKASVCMFCSLYHCSALHQCLVGGAHRMRIRFTWLRVPALSTSSTSTDECGLKCCSCITS